MDKKTKYLEFNRPRTAKCQDFLAKIRLLFSYQYLNTRFRRILTEVEWYLPIPTFY